MGYYRKRPVTIEARRLPTDDYDEWCDVVAWCGGRAIDHHEHPTAVAAIDTLEGTMYAEPGDWVIKGVAGEFYPCKPEVFTASYEPVVNR